MRARVCEGRAPWFLGVLTRPALSKKKTINTEGLLPRVFSRVCALLAAGASREVGGNRELAQGKAKESYPPSRWLGGRHEVAS